MRMRTDVSSGGVVIDDEGRVLLCARRDGQGKLRWVLPKGIVEAQEEPLETALREVSEETGIRAEVMSELETIEYWYVDKYGEEPVRVHKFVHFYLMHPTGGDISERDHEMETVEWVSAEEAMKRVAYPTEKKVLSLAVGA